MKKSLIIFAFCTLGFGFIQCEKIDNPFPPTTIVDTTNTNVNFNDTVVASTNNLKRILLEDYTGQQCGNCPQAADLAEQLYQNNSDVISILAIHAGHFAEPDRFDPKFSLDLTTEEGDIYDNEFGNSAKGNPNGMINRLQIPDGNYVIKPAQWSSVIDSLVRPIVVNNPTININLTSVYNTESRVIRLFSNSTLNRSFQGNYNLVAFFYEGGIIGYHKKYDGNQTLYLENYEFKHVLKSAQPTAWGKLFIDGSAAINDVIEDEIAFTLPTDWNDDNVGVILSVFNVDTREVIQTIEIKKIKNN